MSKGLGVATSLVAVDLGVDGSGLATYGTKVRLDVASSDPAGVASIADGPIVVGTRDTLDLVVGEPAKTIELRATFDGGPGNVITTCRSIGVLGGAASDTSCP